MTEMNFGSPLRRRILVFIIIGFISVLMIQLFQLQILQNVVYEEKANENSIKGIVIDAPRGIFYDRNMNVIISNKPSFTLQITPYLYDDKHNFMIESVLGVEQGYLTDIFSKNKKFSVYLPRKVRKGVEFDFIAWYEENHEKLPGVEYIVELQRDYSFGVNGAHIFGYTKEISSQQLEKVEFKDKYDMGDLIGSTGIEKIYESYLRGTKGVRYILVDSKRKTVGRYLEGKNDKPPVKGNDLILTIDVDAQIAAENALQGKQGAVVAIEPKTGEILVLASAPNYNLSKFAAVTSSEIWKELSQDPEKPLFNRATMSINSPGSTFKVLEAVAALEEKIISPGYTIECKGGYRFGNRTFKCTHVHGKVDLLKSIEKSCNTYYYGLILKIGLDKWTEYSAKFGFGSKTGIDLPEEAAGILPSTEYYNRAFGKGGWTQGYLLSLGIGQGELSATPVQMAKYTALLANNGKSKVPHLVRGYINSRTEEMIKFDYDDINLDISDRSFNIAKEGMYRVVHGEGTARHIKIKGIEIAGKTGTVQNPHGEDHALFIAFAPYDDPQIAVSVIVENSGFGSTHAAPVARDVIKAYLQKTASLNQKDLITKAGG
jgi:penicillin-binding protein 2